MRSCRLHTALMGVNFTLTTTPNLQLGKDLIIRCEVDTASSQGLEDRLVWTSKNSRGYLFIVKCDQITKH